MIEYLEADLTGASIDALNDEDLVLAEDSNSDEAITKVSEGRNGMEIYLEREQNTESYKETMNIDIENINIIEKRHKIYTE